MISPERRKIKKSRSETFETNGTARLFRLSAAMVELSLRHDRPDSPVDLPTSVPQEAECHSAEAKLQQPISTNIATDQEVNKAAQLAYSALVQAARELSRIAIFRINSERAKIYNWLRARMGSYRLPYWH